MGLETENVHILSLQKQNNLQFTKLMWRSDFVLTSVQPILQDPLQYSHHIHLPLSQHHPRNGSAMWTTLCTARITIPKPTLRSIFWHSLYTFFPSTTAAAADLVWSYITTPIWMTSLRIHTCLLPHTLVLMSEVLEALLIVFQPYRGEGVCSHC
jgi:hypothetical protein